ncbi:NAD(P)/FAD-dependent oxidoreductase [Streptomyces sp. TP-A0356]|uniref:NAD(P)/FAD-dependent oxidoreductase n=1 Tax=Streptomyces sp. TP-A0356 TaxID=1359208 RepID=UPI0006E2AA4E|nr:FAD-dependent oxidoreductase [Streptomyces sp. TP-A0356]
MSTRRYLLVGGGVAAASAASHLRRRGFDGQIVLIGEEPDPPYERPLLSKGFLAGTADFGELQAREPAWYDEQEVELRLGTRVASFDPGARSVTLSTGERLGYDALVLATGLRPRKLPGFDGERVHHLRTVADARRLHAELVCSQRLVVLGAGFVGCEVAATAAGLGKHVTVLEPAGTPLERALGSAIGTVLTEVHREHGVDVRPGEYATSLTPTRDGLLLTTNLGERVECDLVLVSVGSEPNVELAVRAGLATGNGIVVDECGRTTAPGVYAVGDVAAQYHPVYRSRIRVEHHDNAQRQGANVAATLTGASEGHADTYWFWSDQYEHSLQAAGRPQVLDGLVIRGSLAERSFSAFSLAGDRIRGVISLNRPGDVLAVRRLLFEPHQVNAEQLRDESVPLKRLVPRTRGAAARV